MVERTSPLLGDSMFITDGGLETTLVYQEGIDLPYFAAFPLLDDASGREALTRYYTHYLAIAERDGVGMVLDTPTWRANPDWGSLLGYDPGALAALNRRSVEFIREIAAGQPGVVTVLDGVIGPRGDGYVVEEPMSASDAAAYHRPQIQAFHDARVDMVSAVTMTYLEEAIGIARSSADAELAAVISFTVETDGRLPSGQPLGEAIQATDEATDRGPLYYMINCAHPTHFMIALESGGAWLERIGAIRANASRMSHAELDNAVTLDRGDPAGLATDYVKLRSLLPALRVVGGCCGTDHEHISVISGAMSP